jgi:hypothetical protein
MSSLRNLPENFQQGCDVSASRIESNLDSLLAAVNKVKPNHQGARFVETRQVLGFQPVTQAAPPYLPWMRAYNDIDASVLEPPTTFDNSWRLKATTIPEDIVPELNSGNMLTWETSWVSSMPTMLKDFSVFMAVDFEYPNTFIYGAVPPTGKVTGDSVNDWCVQFFIDSALDTDDRKAVSVEQVWTNRKMAPFAINPVAGPGPDTMSPPHPQDGVEGYLIRLPSFTYIPAGARCRVAITIPQYPMPGAPAASGWDQYPHVQQVMSACISLLEPRWEV